MCNIAILCICCRTIMSQYEGQDSPVLATETEEKRLLRHLNKITKRAERTAEEDEIIRRGYFKVLHRVLDSLSTMDHRDEMDRLQLKRTVQYVSTRLVDFWNSGVPVIKSYYRDGEIRLISSQGMLLSDRISCRCLDKSSLDFYFFCLAAVFQDMWTSIRSQRYLRESRERALQAGCSIVGRKVSSASSVKTNSNLKSIQALAKRTISSTVRRTQKRHSYSASSSPSNSSQSSVYTSPGSSSVSSHAAAMSPAEDSMDSPHGGAYAVSDGDSPVVGRSSIAARRCGIQTRSVTSATSSPVSNRSAPSTPGSVLPRKALYSANEYDSEREGDSDDESDDEMLFGEAESDAEGSDADHEEGRVEKGDQVPVETPHQVRWGWTADSDISHDTGASEDAQSAEKKVDAIFKKHLGDKRKKFSRADLEDCTTPASAAAKMVLSGSSISCGWDGDEADLAVESDAEHEEEEGEDGSEGGLDSEQEDHTTERESVQGSSSEEEEMEVVNETPNKPAKVATRTAFSPSSSQDSTPTHKTHLRWAPLDEEESEAEGEDGAEAGSDGELDRMPQRERSLSSMYQVTPHQNLVQSGAAFKAHASPMGRAHLGPELCSSAEQVSAAADQAAVQTPSVHQSSSALGIAIETARSGSTDASGETPGSVASTESRRKHKSHKNKKAKLTLEESHFGSPVGASSLASVSARKSPSTPASSILADSSSFQSPPASLLSHSERACHTAGSSVYSSSARSQLSASFQSPCGDDASEVSSVCTSATTPSNGLVYLDLQQAKAERRLRKKERRERKARRAGDGTKHRKREQIDPMPAVSAVVEGDESPASEVHDRSALTAILGSHHTPSL